jgi:hypothetical protein
MVMERADGSGKSIYYIKSVKYNEAIAESVFASGAL